MVTHKLMSEEKNILLNARQWIILTKQTMLIFFPIKISVNIGFLIQPFKSNNQFFFKTTKHISFFVSFSFFVNPSR